MISRRVKPRLFCCYGLITRTQRKKRRRGNHLSTLTFFFWSQTSQVVCVVSWRTESWAQSCSKNSIQVPVICFFLGPWNLHLPECQFYGVVCHLREHWLSTYPVFPEWLWLRHYSLVPPKKTRKCFLMCMWHEQSCPRRATWSCSLQRSVLCKIKLWTSLKIN